MSFGGHDHRIKGSNDVSWEEQKFDLVYRDSGRFGERNLSGSVMSMRSGGSKRSMSSKGRRNRKNDRIGKSAFAQNNKMVAYSISNDSSGSEQSSSE